MKSSLAQDQGLAAPVATDRSYSALEQIPPTSTEFLPALIELQKIHYARQEWDLFFGYAIYYRHKFLSSGDLNQQKRDFSARLLSLEVLALGKQCHWNEAREISESSIALAKQLGLTNEIPELEKAAALLKLQNVFPQARRAATGSQIPDSVFRSKNHWPIQSKSIGSVSHPRFLKLKLENNCQ